MIAVADSGQPPPDPHHKGRMDYAINPRPSSYIPPGRVHGGGANVLFCDGHVTWHPQADLLIPEPDTIADAPKIRMWNNDHMAMPWDNFGPGKGP